MAVEPTIVIDQFNKYSNETYMIGVDNSKNMGDGEYVVVADSDITAVDADGVDATIDVLDNAAKAVGTADQSDISTTPVTNALLSTRVKAGTAGVTYTITFKAVTSAGNTYETDVKMKVI